MAHDDEDRPDDVSFTAAGVSRHTTVDRAPTSGLIVGRFAEPVSYAVSREFGAQSWLLMVTESGAGRVRFGRAAPTRAVDAGLVPRGSAILLPANVPHAYTTSPTAAPWRFWVHFQMRRKWLDRFPAEVASAGLVVGALPEPVVVDLITGFGRLHAAARWPGYGPVPAAVEEELVALAASDLGWALAAPQVEMLLVQLASTVAARPTRLADELAHVCSAELGRPLMHEVRRIRLEHAARLLAGAVGVAGGPGLRVRQPVPLQPVLQRPVRDGTDRLPGRARRQLRSMTARGHLGSHLGSWSRWSSRNA